MSSPGGFSVEWLKLDAARAVDHITTHIRDMVFKDLKRKGLVLGLSGGVDSSVVAALSARARLGRRAYRKRGYYADDFPRGPN